MTLSITQEDRAEAAARASRSRVMARNYQGFELRVYDRGNGRFQAGAKALAGGGYYMTGMYRDGGTALEVIKSIVQKGRTA